MSGFKRVSEVKAPVAPKAFFAKLLKITTNLLQGGRNALGRSTFT